MSEMKLNTIDSCNFDELRQMVNELDDGVILSLDLKEVITDEQEDGESERDPSGEYPYGEGAILVQHGKDHWP